MDANDKKELLKKVISYTIGILITGILIFFVGAKPCSVNIIGVSLDLPFCDRESTSPIEGKWIATVEGTGWQTEMIITIVPNCKAGQVCGTINLPAVPCQASIYIRNIEGKRYDYDAVDHEGNCGAPGVEYLELQSDGSLKYSYNGDTIFLRRK